MLCFRRIYTGFAKRDMSEWVSVWLNFEQKCMNEWVRECIQISFNTLWFFKFDNIPSHFCIHHTNDEFIFLIACFTWNYIPYWIWCGIKYATGGVDIELWCVKSVRMYQYKDIKLLCSVRGWDVLQCFWHVKPQFRYAGFEGIDTGLWKTDH